MFKTIQNKFKKKHLKKNVCGRYKTIDRLNLDATLDTFFYLQ